jgi:hypothetical protein
MNKSKDFVNSLSEHDKEIYHKACRLHFTEWAETFELGRQAESAELYETIRNIREELYHREEAFAGCL